MFHRVLAYLASRMPANSEDARRQMRVEGGGDSFGGSERSESGVRRQSWRAGLFMKIHTSVDSDLDCGGLRNGDRSSSRAWFTNMGTLRDPGLPSWLQAAIVPLCNTGDSK